MRIQFILSIAVFFVLIGSSVDAADWELVMAKSASGDRLTTLSEIKPFWIILTNKSNHAWMLPRCSETTAFQYLDHLSFVFSSEKTNEIFVGIGSYFETWNEEGPEVVEPGRSYLIKVNLTLGNWLHVRDLRGLMKVKALYQNVDNRMTHRVSTDKPPTWTGKIESSPIEVRVVP